MAVTNGPPPSSSSAWEHLIWWYNGTAYVAMVARVGSKLTGRARYLYAKILQTRGRGGLESISSKNLNRIMKIGAGLEGGNPIWRSTRFRVGNGLLTGRVKNGSITSRGKHGKVARPLLASLGRMRAARTGEAGQAGPVPIEVKLARLGWATPRIWEGKKKWSGRAQLLAGFRPIAK
jgi:hypothetical protein